MRIKKTWENPINIVILQPFLARNQEKKEKKKHV
jgi:hypothetical protein